MAVRQSTQIVRFRRRARHVRHPRWQAAIAALDARIASLEGRVGAGHMERRQVRSRMRSAFIFSLLVHVFLIYGVTVKIPDRSFLDSLAPKLEVVLVNAKSKAAPQKADALAQHNLDGGGNTDDKRRAQNPLPVLPDSKPETDVKLALKRVERLEREARQLITTKEAKAPPVQTAEAAPKAAPTPAPQPEVQSPLHGSEILQRSLEIARLEAKIARDWDSYQQRPRRRFIGARTQEFRFARYIEDWRQKIERVGEMNYPQAARDQKLSGNLVVTVAIRADGSVEQVDVNRSSGNKLLDEAARRIVGLAAPFSAFPQDIAKDVDILHITRTWTFTPADKFVSE